MVCIYRKKLDYGFLLRFERKFLDLDVSSLFIYDYVILGYRVLWGIELVFRCDEEIWCFREGNYRGDYCYCSFGL